MNNICPCCGQEIPSNAVRFDGAEFRRLRVRDGISLAEIARRTGIRPATLSDIERGNRGVSEEHREKLAAAIGVYSWALMTDRMPESRRDREDR